MSRILWIAVVVLVTGRAGVARADDEGAEPLAPRVVTPAVVPIAATGGATHERSVDFETFVGRVLAPSLSMQSVSIQPKVFGWFSGFGLNVRGTL